MIRRCYPLRPASTHATIVTVAETALITHQAGWCRSRRRVRESIGTVRKRSGRKWESSDAGRRLSNPRPRRCANSGDFSHSRRSPLDPADALQPGVSGLQVAGGGASPAP